MLLDRYQQSFLNRVKDNLEETKKTIDEVLDIAIIDEVIQQYSSILNTIEYYEKSIRMELETFSEGVVKNPYRTKNEMYQTLTTLISLRIDLLNLLTKLKQKKEQVANFTLNINFKSQQNENDYIEVELEE